MNQEIKTRWLEALRSGEFTQGTGQLVNTSADVPEDRYCCLGVLCEIAVEDNVVYKDTVRSGFQVGPSVGDFEFYLLPKDVQDWAEIELSSGAMIPVSALTEDEMTSLKQNCNIDDPDVQVTLANINDYSGADFNRIADLIEEYL